MGYFVEGLKNYVRFDGRATRTQFWFYVLWSYLFVAAATVIDVLIGTSHVLGDYGLITGVFIFATLLPTLTIEIRRLHDIGKSGLWIFINIIPVIGLLVLLILACRSSDPGLNKYGPPVNHIVLGNPTEVAGDPADSQYVQSEDN